MRGPALPLECSLQRSPAAEITGREDVQAKEEKVLVRPHGGRGPAEASDTPTKASP